MVHQHICPRFEVMSVGRRTAVATMRARSPRCQHQRCNHELPNAAKVFQINTVAIRYSYNTSIVFLWVVL